MLGDEDQGVQSHVLVSSDYSGPGIGLQRGEWEELEERSPLVRILDNERLDGVVQVAVEEVEDCTLQPLPYGCITRESDIIKESRAPLPKTPEGKRTDFWNDTGYTGNVNIGSEEITDIEGLFSHHAPLPSKPLKAQMKQMVLSADVPPVLIKQSGKRIESTTVDDPFKGNQGKLCYPEFADLLIVDQLAMHPPPSSFLERLKSISNGSVSLELKMPLEDRPQTGPQRLKCLKGKLLNATWRHIQGTKARAAMKTISNTVTHKEYLKLGMPRTKEETGKSPYAGLLTMRTEYGVDMGRAQGGSGSPLNLSSGTGSPTSIVYMESSVDHAVDEELPKIVGGTVNEAGSEGESSSTGMQDQRDIFEELGKVSICKYAGFSVTLISIVIRE